MRLYHGTAGDFDETSEHLIPPAWLSEVKEVARKFSTWRGKTNVRVIEYRVAAPLRLIKLPDKETLDHVFGELVGDVETMAEWTADHGYDGWIVPNNYPDVGGSDIMLWATDQLQYVGTEQIAEAGIYSMADRIEEIMGAGGFEDPPKRQPLSLSQRSNWPGGAGVPTKNPRFEIPRPNPKPEMNYLGQSDLDTLQARIQAEEALPPHQRNEARIHALKKQAMELMRRIESNWVRQTADRMLPRLDEDQAA